MGVRVVFLPNFPLVLSLLKHRDVEILFFNQKNEVPNRESLFFFFFFFIRRESLLNSSSNINTFFTNYLVTMF